MKRVAFPTIIAAAALVAVLVIYMVTFQVRFNEQAVRIRFGRADSNVILEPGLQFKWPRPFEDVRIYDRRLHIIDTPETEVKTADGQNLIVGCYAVWEIKDPLLYSQRLPDDNKDRYRDGEEKLRVRITEARQTVIGRHNMADLFNLDPALVAKSREAIHKEMLDAAAPGLLTDYGINLRYVAIRRNTVPEETTQAILASMSAERNALAEGYRQEGKSRADAIKSAASAGKEKIMAFARRKAERIKSEGDRAAARILEQIRTEDSDLFIWLRYLDALDAALKERSTIFLDWNTDLFKIFNAPLAAPKLPEPGHLPNLDGPKSE
ncbi:MAG: protease modulator HflC [Planctomycetes bacterium]|nr:protease modulator HflC [Planctomycetota bacterium]